MKKLWMRGVAVCWVAVLLLLTACSDRARVLGAAPSMNLDI